MLGRCGRMASCLPHARLGCLEPTGEPRGGSELSLALCAHLSMATRERGQGVRSLREAWAPPWQEEPQSGAPISAQADAAHHGIRGRLGALVPKGGAVCPTWRRGTGEKPEGPAHRHLIVNRFGASGQWVRGPQGSLGCSKPGLCSGSWHEGPRSATGKAERAPRSFRGPWYSKDITPCAS